MADADERRELRARLRRARRALSGAERREAAQRIARALAATGWLRRGRRVAGFVATTEEIDTTPSLAAARARGCELYLPRLTHWRAGRMALSPIGPRRRLNRYGIPEPDTTGRVGARWMQLVLVPLVGVDRAGNRLGMGAGFYDRLLAFRRLRRSWRGPRLVGVCHSAQLVEHLPARSHDVPLDALLTERGLTFFRRRPS